MLTVNKRTAGPAALLHAALSELLEGASVERVIATETFSVHGKPAGRVVARAPVNETPIEGYLGAVVTGGWAFSVVALYKVDDTKKSRAAADTVLVTLKVKGCQN